MYCRCSHSSFCACLNFRRCFIFSQSINLRLNDFLLHLAMFALQVVERSQKARATKRLERIKEYFYGIRHNLFPYNFIVRFTDVVIWKIGGKVKVGRFNGIAITSCALFHTLIYNAIKCPQFFTIVSLPWAAPDFFSWGSKGQGMACGGRY
jgi:hypothetical protein